VAAQVPGELKSAVKGVRFGPLLFTLDIALKESCFKIRLFSFPELKF
jgi:hypothetical protein